MLTFGYGKYFVRASSIDEGLEIVRELERLDQPKRKHVFDYHRQCVNCGLFSPDAAMNPCNGQNKKDS